MAKKRKPSESAAKRPPASEGWHDREVARTRDYKQKVRQEKREIGPIDACVNRSRRRRTKFSYPKFCETYFPSAFLLPWSRNHYLAAERIERAVLDGGLFAFAMPRGSGKTTMCEWAAMWALCHAHKSFVVLIGATGSAAGDRLDSIKIELTENELLRADFPEVCQPLWALGSGWRLTDSQTCQNRQTKITWKKERVVLPTVTNKRGRQYPTSGAVIHVAGLTGEIRGKTHKRINGSLIRPDFAIADDPQTSESARSPIQSTTRAQILAADVAYLAGPGKAISVVVPCTVIAPNDMAERILDRELHPEYRGVRTKMVEKFPEDMTLWDEYSEILKDSWRNDGDHAAANEFYAKNRAKMDEDFIVAWPERFSENELSGIQHAMNFYVRDRDTFFSECQNEPQDAVGELEIMATPAEILAKMGDYGHFICPKDTTVVTAMIDVKLTCLHYLVACWGPGFVGYVIDYGVWPDQGGRRILSASKLARQFDDQYPRRSTKEQVYAALKECLLHINRVYEIDGGRSEATLDRVLVDANLGQVSNTVYQFCRECASGVTVTPSHGVYVGAVSKPWSEHKRQRGERVGNRWRERPSAEWPIKHVNIDVNYWKTTVHQLLKAGVGGSATLHLYGRDTAGRKLNDRYHSELADQICAEYVTKVEAKERTVHEWKERPNHPDNEGLDLLVGAAVAASMQGIELPGSKTPNQRRTKAPISFRDAYMRNANITHV